MTVSRVFPSLTILLFVACASPGQTSADDAFKRAVSHRNVRVLGEAARGHADVVNSVHYARDGRLALSAGDDAAIKVWNARSGKLVKAIQAEHAVKFAYFAGTEIVSLEADGTLRFRNARSGRILGEIPVLDPVVAGMAGVVTPLAGSISPDDKELVFAEPKGHTFVRIDLRGRKKLAPIKMVEGQARDVVFSGDGKYLVLARIREGRGAVTIGDLAKLVPVHTTIGARMTRVAASGDSRRFVVASNDKFELRRLSTGKSIRDLRGPGEAVTCVMLDRAGSRMFYGSVLNHVVPCVNLETQKTAFVLDAHTSSVRSVALSPDQKSIMTGSADHSVRFWRAADGKMVFPTKGHASRVDALAFSADGDRLLSGGRSGKVVLWNTETGAIVHQTRWPERAIVGTAFSEAGGLLSASRGNVIRIWEAKTGKLVKRVPVSGDAMSCFSLSRSRALGLGGSWGPTTRVWDMKTMTVKRELTHDGGGKGSDVYCAAFSPDEKTVATGDGEGNIRVWNMATGKVTHTLRRGDEWISGIQFVDDDTLVAGDAAGALRVWTIGEQQPKANFVLAKGEPITNVEVSHDGKMLLASTAKRVRFLDTHTWKTVRELDAFPSGVTVIALSRDERHLATGMADSTVLLWDLSKVAR